VRSGPRLGDAGDLRDVLAGEAPAGRQLAHLEAARAKLLGDVDQQPTLVVALLLAAALALEEVRAVRGEPVELHAGELLDEPHQPRAPERRWHKAISRTVSGLTCTQNLTPRSSIHDCQSRMFASMRSRSARIGGVSRSSTDWPTETREDSSSCAGFSAMGRLL